jgi:hypothetical protein
MQKIKFLVAVVLGVGIGSLIFRPKPSDPIHTTVWHTNTVTITVTNIAEVFPSGGFRWGALESTNSAYPLYSSRVFGIVVS